MKQTATEWLFQQLWETPIDKLTWYAILKQAKEMEKEQLKQLMWDLTDVDEANINKGLLIDNRFDIYWNETFKSE